MPIEFDRIKDNTHFNKFYGTQAASRSGNSTAPYTLGWSNRYGPPGANERVYSDYYDYLANPGVVQNTGILGHKRPFQTTFYQPWYGPVNNIYKVSISGIANDGGPGSCIDCDKLNGDFYVNITSQQVPFINNFPTFIESHIGVSPTVHQSRGHLWQGSIGRNREPPCGNIFSSGRIDILSDGITTSYDGRFNKLYMSLSQNPIDDGAGTGATPSGGNVYLFAYFPGNPDYRAGNDTVNNYGAAFVKDFGYIDIYDLELAKHRPLMLEGSHSLIPYSGTVYAGIDNPNTITGPPNTRYYFHASGDNTCNYTNALCTIEPYKESYWDYRQVKTFFETPYGLPTTDSQAHFCSGNQVAHFVPSAFRVNLSGVNANFTNNLCLDCNTYYKEPITLRRSTGGNFRYEWVSTEVQSYITKYNICEYGCYDYNKNASFPGFPYFGLDNWQRARDLPPQSYCHNKVTLDLIQSGTAPYFNIPSSGYRVTAELSFYNGPVVGPKFTKQICESPNCTYLLAISGYNPAVGLINCLQDSLYSGGWIVDSGLSFISNSVSTIESGIYMNTSAAHLCNFTNATPIVVPNTHYSDFRDVSTRAVPCIFNTRKKIPQTLTMNYASADGQVTYIYNNSPLQLCTYDDAPQGNYRPYIRFDGTNFLLPFLTLSDIAGGTLPTTYYAFNGSPGGNIVIGPNVGSKTNARVDFDTANWTTAISGTYYKIVGFGGILVPFTITATLGDFVTIDYP